MKNIMVYIHGKGGSAEEAKYYRKFFNEDFDIIGFDYKSKNPWDAKVEFSNYFDSIISKYNKIILIANGSLTANYSLYKPQPLIKTGFQSYFLSILILFFVAIYS